MRGFIMMTALPPTKGHAYLIEWARQYCLYAGIRTLNIMVCGQIHEPITAEQRVDAFKAHFAGCGNGVWLNFLPFTKTMPDKPEDHPDFWNMWKREIHHTVGQTKGDIIFTSEVYGAKLAEELEGTWVNCNIYRDVVNMSGTRVREHPFEHFSYIIPSAQPLFRKTITVFGPESTGKTTIAKKLAMVLPGHYVPEWAREYLEQQESPETTKARMQEIVFGQMASQETVHKFCDKPFIIQDTDLLSTIGFYELYHMESLPAERFFIPADHYILLKDNVPFVPDRLRYGGDRRESDYRFWEGLLKEHKLSYTLIDEDAYIRRFKHAIEVCESVFKSHAMWKYRR